MAPESKRERHRPSSRLLALFQHSGRQSQKAADCARGRHACDVVFGGSVQNYLPPCE
jgi:hypothetical protein